MNCTLSRITEADEIGVHSNLPTTAPLVSNEFATAPIPIVMPAYQAPDEEELYTSFEAAMSERISSLHDRLSYLSDPALYARLYAANSRVQTHKTLSASPLVRGVVGEQVKRFLPLRKWQRYLIFVGLALICTMLGFDLMGLLVLSIR